MVPIDVASAGGGRGDERPKRERHRSHGPGRHGPHRSRPPPPPPPAFRPFRRWFPFLVPLFIVANIVLFVLTMYVNDCPAHARATGAAIGGSVGESATAQGCWLAPELGRFAFQSFKENPLIGPSSATYATLFKSVQNLDLSAVCSAYIIDLDVCIVEHVRNSAEFCEMCCL